jgi:hypothetical protein
MPTDPENERVTDTELNECDEKFWTVRSLVL